MSAARRVIALVNGSAGTADAHGLRDLEQSLRGDAGDVSVRIAGEGEDLGELARAAAREAPDVIVAAGGDGTINAVASAIVDSDIALGVLPLGTLNHFAKALRLPLQWPAAADVVRRGRIRRIDVGDINGRIFLNNSSLGLYPRMVQLREKQQQHLGRSKWTAAAWAAISVMRRHALLKVRLTLDGDVVQRRTALIFIGNNAYEMNGLRIGERERLDGGCLGVYLPRRGGRRGLPLLALRALCGRLRPARDFDAVLARSVDIDAHRPRLLVATDGEISLIDTPLRYRIRPGALRVVAPAAE